MLNWARPFNIFCFLDNHAYDLQGHRFDCLLGAGAGVIFDPSRAIDGLDAFLAGRQWVFCHLTYEAKNLFFPTPASKPDLIGFPAWFFFEPRIVIALSGDVLRIDAADPDSVYKELHDQAAQAPTPLMPVTVSQRLTEGAYLDAVRGLQRHIRRGDCYEINFCQEFYGSAPGLDPLTVYDLLAAASPAPYSAFYRCHDSFLLCASPERFLQKRGDTLIAQPMKGTSRRSTGDGAEDAAGRRALVESRKERAENVMIVDLMRNDLSKVCRDGSVRVSELFGVYTFPHVHQMVSTVEGELEGGKGFLEILGATFPMGSMTGAPKKRVLELIDAFETGPRGLFSGSVGYFYRGDFDLNVVIRSLLYNARTGYLSFPVGSGITTYSDPDAEWSECLLKAAAIKKVLTGGSALG
jgi:para-aminobenzoate synthetase component 1